MVGVHPLDYSAMCMRLLGLSTSRELIESRIRQLWVLASNFQSCTMMCHQSSDFECSEMEPTIHHRLGASAEVKGPKLYLAK